MPTAVAAGLAGALPDIKQEQVHVLVGDVGGGFGSIEPQIKMKMISYSQFIKVRKCHTLITYMMI